MPSNFRDHAELNLVTFGSNFSRHVPGTTTSNSHPGREHARFPPKTTFGPECRRRGGGELHAVAELGPAGLVRRRYGALLRRVSGESGTRFHRSASKQSWSDVGIELSDDYYERGRQLRFGSGSHPLVVETKGASSRLLGLHSHDKIRKHEMFSDRVSVGRLYAHPATTTRGALSSSRDTYHADLSTRPRVVDSELKRSLPHALTPMFGDAKHFSTSVQRMAEWRWIPDQDRTPDNPRVKPPASINVDRKESKAGAPGIPAGAANPSSPQQTDAPYSAEELTRWKPGPLKELLAGLGLDASGCAEKKDVVEKIMRHPGGAAAAAAAATARGETIAVPGRGAQSPGQEEGGDGRSARSAEETTAAATAEKGGEEEEEDGFVGMTLADYMGRPTEENGGDHADFGAGGGRPGGGGPSDRGGGGGGGGPPGGGQGGGVRGRDGRGGGAGGDGEHGRLDRARPASISGSASGGRDELSSAASGRGGKVVRLAPAHIAPPSRPAPEWVVHMQVRCP